MGLSPLIVMLVALILPAPSSARAAEVRGAVSEHGGAPARSREVRFENRASGDVFLTTTAADGTFKVDLPPGIYDLREDSGALIKGRIAVGRSRLDIGRVTEPAAYNPRRLFELEGINETIIHPAAPATANPERARSRPSSTAAKKKSNAAAKVAGTSSSTK